MSAEAVELADEEQPIVPKSWKPSKAEPVPVVRCTMIKANGERCKRWSLRGTTVCVRHGASLPTVREHAEAVVESARLRLVGNADAAVDVLEDLMQVGTSENVRLKAATEILDRTGIRGGVDIHTETEVTINPSEELANRLAMLRKRSEEAQERMSEVFGATVIDGEIVEESEDQPLDQPALFDM